MTGVQTCALPIYHLVEELLAPGPVRDDAAAAEQYAHAARKPRSQVRVGAVHRFRRYLPGLAAGEKDVFAGLISRLGPAQKRLGVREYLVIERELVHGKAHLAGGDHVPPRGKADLGHVVAVGAGHGALAA